MGRPLWFCDLGNSRVDHGLEHAHEPYYAGAEDLLAWLPCAIFGAMAVAHQLVALHARHVQRTVNRAGLGPAIGIRAPAA